MKKDNLLLLVIGLLPWSLWSVFYGVKVLPKLDHAKDLIQEGKALLSPQPKDTMLRATVENRDMHKGQNEIEDRTPRQEPVAGQNSITPSEKSQQQAENLAVIDVHYNSNEDAPLFVLQVGPSKTGTSTLQWFASENEMALQKDNFYFLGNYRHNHKHPEWNLHKLCESCYSCQWDPENCQCEENWAAFEKNVNHHYEQGHNVLVIEEMFTNFLNPENEREYLWNKLLPLLTKWRVRIIFTYRRYYEWIPSAYFQAYNPDGTGTNKNKIAQRNSWPHESGKEIPTFESYFASYSKRLDRQPAGMIAKWRDRFPNNVWVFNMNNPGDFMQTFFCKMLPEASKFCTYLKSNTASVTRNPSSSKNLHFDMLAVEAYKRGWLDTKNKGKKKATRKEARDAVKEFSKTLGLESVNDFTPTCLSKEQIKLLRDRSLDLEKDLVRGFFESPLGEADLRAKFAEYEKSGKFCSVDVHKTFEDERWKNFFVSFKQSKVKGKKSKGPRQNKKQ